MATDGGGPARFGPWRREARAYLELLGACTLAIAQPAFGTMSRNVGTLIVRDVTWGALVGVALVVALLPPLLAWCLEVAVGLVAPRARRYAHAVLLGAAAGLFALQLTKTVSGLGAAPLIVVGAAVAIGATTLALRSNGFGSALRFAVVALPVFLVQFLVFSPAHRAVTGSDVSASGARIGDPTRVVMVVFDEFPLTSILDGTGAIDRDLFPNLAALAETSTWYRNTTTVAPATEQAVPALLTGQYPEAGKVPVAADHPDSLFRLLGGRYRMNVHEPIERICPATVCTSRTSPSAGLRGFASLVRESARLFATAASPRRAVTTYAELVDIPPARPAANAFLASLEPSSADEPVLDYVHILLPHQPWHYLPTFQDTSPEGTPVFSKANLTAWKSEGTATIARTIHLAQARAADGFLGRVRERLEAMGEWDDSLVVVTADHGAAFDAGESARVASRRTAPHILWTPLLVKDAGQRTPVIDDRRMQSIDVLPTVASALETEIPWAVDGVAPVGPPRRSVPPRLYQWRGPLMPEDAEVAEEGEFLTYSQTRFAEVLRSRVAPEGPTELRTYGAGPHADLVGRPAAPLVQDPPGGPTELYLRTGSAPFAGVDPAAPRLPVVWQRGYVQGAGDAPRTIAFAINGVVAGFGFSDPVGEGLGYYFASLAPTLLRPGANSIAAYVVRGDPADPVLDPVRIGN